MDDFLKQIQEMYDNLKSKLLYFFDKDEPHDRKFALSLMKWFAEVATKNNLIHEKKQKEKNKENGPKGRPIKDMENVRRRRKEVYFMDFGVNIGSEFNSPHFAVVIKESKYTAIVVPLSSEKDKIQKWKEDDDLIVAVGCLDDLPKDKKPCYALVNQIRAVSKQRLSTYELREDGKSTKYKLKLTDLQMDIIDEAVKLLHKN